MKISEEQLQNALYELYKADWVLNHVPQFEQYEVRREYEFGVLFGEVEGSFDDYIFENGYHGNVYACFDEFLDAEYLDREYMQSLVRDCRSPFLESPFLNDTAKQILQVYDEYNEPDLEKE